MSGIITCVLSKAGMTSQFVDKLGLLAENVHRAAVSSGFRLARLQWRNPVWYDQLLQRTHFTPWWFKNHFACGSFADMACSLVMVCACPRTAQIEKALWDAEKPLVAAVKKMYPQVYMKVMRTCC